MVKNTLALAATVALLSGPAWAQPPAASHDHKGMSGAAMTEHMKSHKHDDMTAKAGPAVASPDVVVKVNGLVCDFCARSLEKAFNRTGRVSGVAVDLTAKEVRLRFAAGKSMDDATIRKLVKDAGYAVVSLQRRAA